MSAIGLRRKLLRCRRHLAAMAALLAITAAIGLHHSGIATGAMEDHHGMSATVEMCLGVLTAVGAGLAAVAFGVLALGRWRPVPTLRPVGLALRARPPIPRARAGPALLSLLCVSRR